MHICTPKIKCACRAKKCKVAWTLHAIDSRDVQVVETSKVKVEQAVSLAMAESHTFSIPYELMIILHPGWIALGYTANVSLRAKPVLSAIRFVGRRIQPTLARLTFDPYLGQGRSTTYIFPSLSPSFTFTSQPLNTKKVGPLLVCVIHSDSNGFLHLLACSLGQACLFQVLSLIHI